ncbi:hypothetical protein AABB24_037453 [Solanum stoloniferum]|uniref:Uncharacterized protein n=1 Tax=Solanum stoloniferum TaxID=62892 RepID=A0ABD2R4M3_9SOLN
MSSSSHPSMALAFYSYSPCKPTSSTNSSFLSSSSHAKQQSNLLFPLRKKFRQQSRSLCIVTGSGSDESNSQDDEVDNLGVKAALSMLNFYKNQQDCVMVDC